MKKEEKREIKARIRAGESAEEILQDAKFQGREEEVQKALSSYQRLSLVIKGMPYSEIARRELQAKGIAEPDEKQIKAIYNALSVLASTEKLVAPLKAKKEEVNRRLASGQSIEEIVADRTLNVCEEAVKAWQGKERKSAKKEPNVKQRKRLTTEERNLIVAQILLGKSAEEISQMEEFQEIDKDSIKKCCQDNDWVLPAIRLVDYAKIAQDTGRDSTTIRTSAKQKSVQGEKITQIRTRKREQLQQCIQNRKEESLEKIAQELEIDVTAARELVSQWEEAERKKEKRLYRREEVMLVVEQMLLGKTPEEIGQMEQFQCYSLENIREVCQAKAWMQDALRLVPYPKIAENLGIHATQLRKDGREFTVGGKSLSQIREEKESQIRQALQEETDFEKIATRFGVEVATVQRYAQPSKVQKQQLRGASQAEKEKVLEQFLAGKTPEEVSQMEEFQIYSSESLTAFYQEKSWIIPVFRLLPIEKVAEQTGRKVSTIRTACSTMTYQGKSISQIRQEKKKQLKEGLEKREKPVEILAQELDIDLEVAKTMQREMIQKQQEQERKAKAAELARAQKAAERKNARPERAEVKKAEKPQAVPEPTKPQPRPIEIPTTPAQASVQPLATREERKQAVQQNSAYFRMRIMQGKYKSRMQRKQQNEPDMQKANKAQSEKERMAIEKILASMEAKVAEAEKEMTKLERKPIMQAMYQEAKLLEPYQLTSTQAERFRKAMYGKAMDLYMHACGPEPHARMTRIQNVADRKMIGAIEAELEQTSDLQKLQSFSNQINSIQGQNAFAKDRLSGIVYRKITQIRNEQAIHRLYYEVPQEVEQIVAGIAAGKLDVAKANEMMDLLAEQKVAENPAKGRFALTQGQQKHQIQMQIRATLSKQAERFPIERPEATLRLLEELGIQETMLNLKAVIENQIARKKFVEAKAFCNVYGKVETDEGRASLYGIRNQIRNAEIGDLVLRGIQGQITPDGAAKFWDTLENGIRMGNVKMSQVILGKTADGKTDITLADVWPESPKQKNR